MTTLKHFSVPLLRQQQLAAWIARMNSQTSRLMQPASVPGRVSLRFSSLKQRRYYSKDIPPPNTPVSAPSTTATEQGVSGTATAVGTESTKPRISKFRQYAEQFKNKPASHLISFGILHEITAVVPLPIVYFALVETGVKIPFPEQAMEEGNRFVQRVAKYYGWNLEGADGARVMLNMATSYAVVKALLPVRLALCVWMTPWTATRVVSPIMNFWRRFKK